MRPSFIQTIHHDVYETIDPRGALANAARGKTVLVSGAGRGIGRAIAMAFVLAGADRLVLTARTEGQLAAVVDEIKAISSEVKVISIPTDIADESQVDALFDAIPGTIDVLVNNAGTAETNLPLGESDVNEWWYTWEVNVKGTYLLTRSFLKKCANAASVINISSMAAIGTTPGYSAYRSSKTAVNRLTSCVHTEYRHVRAFAFHPGGVKTDMLKKVPEHLHQYFIDAPELAGAYCVWLTTEQADFLRGRYSDCTWDVQELMDNAPTIVENDLLTHTIKMG